MSKMILILGIFLISSCSAQSEEKLVIKNNCLNKMKGGEKFCNCMIDKVESNLSENEIKFIAAGFKKDREQQLELKKLMDKKQINRIGDFMTIAVRACSVNK